jgi:hypothetical protein
MTIELADLPDRMRTLAEDMAEVGAAIRYFGGFGPFAEYGEMLESQSAPILRDLARAMEGMGKRRLDA